MHSETSATAVDDGSAPDGEHSTDHNTSFLADATTASSSSTTTAAATHAPLLEPNAAYDADMPLDERERRWGFTLADLRAATRVVRTLFRQPALFVGDGYLADSRLYTMITRDRATKRAHRDVYKAIMNEERTRRKRYERLQYVETVRKTAMKREREDALNALLLANDDGDGGDDGGDNRRRLLLAAAAAATATPMTTTATATASDTTHVSSCASVAANSSSNNNNVNDDDDDDTKAAAAAANLSTPVTADGTALSPREQCVLRLIGAFENMLRLDEAYGKAATATADGGDADAVAITQLTAQVYRYVPHAYGSQMPPPLFAGRVPPQTPAMLWRHYLVGAKLLLAQMAEDAAPLQPLPTSHDNDDSSDMLSLSQHLQRLQASCGSDAAVDVAVCTRAATATLSSIAQLRVCVAASAHVTDDGDHHDDDNAAQTTRLPRDALRALSTCPQTTLRALQTVLIGDDKDNDASEADVSSLLSPLHSDGAALTSTTATATDGDGGDWTAYDVAMQSLHLFIARRVYQYARVNACGISPCVIARAPPTSASVEPDTYCAFDDVQCYASSTAYTSATTQPPPHTQQQQQQQAPDGDNNDSSNKSSWHASVAAASTTTTTTAVASHEALRLPRWVSCHTCKVRYRVLHPYYYSLCHLCGEYNYNKRLLTRDLRGKVVLLTGCRIKIGYAMALSLLRCGATLLGITRFVHEAAARFQQEPDYAVWQHRLHLFAIDLRDLWLVTQFCAFVQRHFPRLFAIVNNATQTIARTPQYTAHLRAIERHPAPELHRVIADDRYAREWYGFFLHHTSVTIGQPLTIAPHHEQLRLQHAAHIEPFLDEHATNTTTTTTTRQLLDHKDNNNNNEQQQQQEGVDTTSSTAVAQHDDNDDDNKPASSCRDRALVFDRYDTQAEESDARAKNSWVLELAEVPTGEAAEVMAINALAPFIINSKLKPCLLRRDDDDDDNDVRRGRDGRAGGGGGAVVSSREARFIINVSAMEGQFYRYKQTTHPHTNMAKAALNMMTRTSGEDYARDGIYMNAVDTGWITDESPMLKKHRRAEQYMLCPLDEVDAAARCLDLIYTDSRVYGKFYKDYKEIAW